MVERRMADSIFETLKEQCDKSVKRGFYWENVIAFVYNSEKMEGNPLSKEDTRRIFETRSLPSADISVDHVIETSNHFELFDLVLDTVDEPLSIKLIKEYHRTLKAGVAPVGGTPQGAGEWKRVPNAVGNVTTARPQDVQREMERLLAAYKPDRPGKAYRDIAGYHVFFERIHPFVDGNGRVGRAIMFHECARFGLVPFIVLDETKARYYAALRSFDEDPDVLIGYFEEMAELYLEEFSKLIPEYLLLPQFEKFIDRDISHARDAEKFFEQ